MPFRADVFKVLIASPGDTHPFRDAVERSLHEWNSDHAEHGPLVLPRRWETDAVPEANGKDDAQTVINRQLVDDADIVIAVFRSRLGTATERAASGTAEELNRSIAAYKPVHVYFREGDHPHDVDLDQLALLRRFRREFRGLSATFTEASQLQEKVRQALTMDLKKSAASTSAAPQGRLEILSAYYGAGERLAEVTDVVRRSAGPDRLTLDVDNSVLGRDPAPGVAKFLAVSYSVDGREDSRAFREGELVSLP